MAEITIYHNPRCSKSRQALAILNEAGHEPEIVLYLETPPTAERLRALLKAMDLTPHVFVRSKERVFKDLGLGNEKLSDSDLIEQMVAHPILIERPVLVSGDHVKLCRSPEGVQEFLSEL